MPRGADDSQFPAAAAEATATQTFTAQKLPLLSWLLLRERLLLQHPLVITAFAHDVNHKDIGDAADAGDADPYKLDDNLAHLKVLGSHDKTF